MLEALGLLRVGLLAGGQARFLWLSADALPQAIATRHKLGAWTAAVAGQAAAATLLMSAHIKGDERITLQIQGENPRFAFIADADSNGGIRARFTPTRVTPHDHLTGILVAIKADAQRELYRGTTEIAHPSIEQALGEYFRASAQTDVLLRIRGDASHVAALLVERLPGSTIDLAAHDDIQLDAVDAGLDAGELGGLEAQLLDIRPVHWRCTCSLDRIEGTLLQLGAAELQSLLQDQGEAEVTCHFCNLAYRVDGPGLERLIVRAAAMVADPTGEC